MNGMPEPVVLDVCPKCNGKRVLPVTKDTNTAAQDILWDITDKPWRWCQLCGGEGTAAAAMERTLIA